MGVAITFVVRVWREPEGAVRGVVERVTTGAKEAFPDAQALASLIERMATEEQTKATAAEDPAPLPGSKEESRT